jgi:two-component system, NarL family, invasion response regulator UvrY
LIKVLVSDGHPVVGLGVKAILSGVDDEAGDWQELLDTAGKKDFNVVIFEIDRPAGNGLDLIKELRNKIPQAAILISTHLLENKIAVRALKMGAAGYLGKQSEPGDLITATIESLRRKNISVTTWLNS